METLGIRLRRQRRRLGLTLDELAGRTHISKPYLSLIETDRVPNPPSDDKLRRLEQSLGFSPNELLTQAHLQRTPQDIRAMLGQLLAGRQPMAERQTDVAAAVAAGACGSAGSAAGPAIGAGGSVAGAVVANGLDRPASAENQRSIDLQVQALLQSTSLRDLVQMHGGDVQQIATRSVPMMDGVGGEYPSNMKDPRTPGRKVETFIGCPDVADEQAFAVRVQGDSMMPKYGPGDIVIFSPALSPGNGDDCFIRFAAGPTTFKRVFFETDVEGKKPMLRLQPRNERYRAVVLASSEIAGMYKAIYRYQRVDEESRS